MAFHDSVLHGSPALLRRILRGSDACIAMILADVASPELPTRLLSQRDVQRALSFVLFWSLAKRVITLLRRGNVRMVDRDQTD